MKSYEQLAKESFEVAIAEAESQGAFAAGAKKPIWEDVEPEFQQGWIAAAKHLWSEFTTTH